MLFIFCDAFLAEVPLVRYSSYSPWFKSGQFRQLNVKSPSDEGLLVLEGLAN